MSFATVVKRVGDWMYGPAEEPVDAPVLRLEVPVPKKLVPVYAEHPEELEVAVYVKTPTKKKAAKKAAPKPRRRQP